MKKIYKCIFLLLFVTLVGCDDDEEVVNELIVTESNVIFGAEGGEGTIKLATDAVITATSSQAEWCTVEVSGNTVNVKVTSNIDIEGRSALIKINSNSGQSTSVPVSQAGSIISIDLSNLIFTEQDEEILIPYKFNSDFDIEIEGDWITYEIREDAIAFTCSHAGLNTIERVAKIKINIVSGAKREINAFYLPGDFLMTYADIENEFTTINVQLSKGANNTFVLSGELIFGIQISLTLSNGKLVLSAGGYLGFLNPYSLYITLQNTEEQVLINNPAVTYIAELTRDSESNYYLAFVDGGMWAYPVNAIGISAYMSGGYEGDFERMRDVKLYFN